MKSWTDNIEELTTQNTTFRTVIYTGQYSQMTVMSIEPNEEIGEEVHEDIDQFIRVEEGQAKVTLGKEKGVFDEEFEIEAEHAVFIPAGLWHNVINIGPEPLKLYSIYSPPEHPANTIHATKADADADEHHH